MVASRVADESLALAFTSTAVSPLPPLAGETVSHAASQLSVQSALALTVKEVEDSCPPMVSDFVEGVAFVTNPCVRDTVLTVLPPDTILRVALRSSIPLLAVIDTCTFTSVSFTPPLGRRVTQSASVRIAQSALALTMSSRAAASGPAESASGVALTVTVCPDGVGSSFDDSPHAMMGRHAAMERNQIMSLVFILVSFDCLLF